MAKLNRMRWGWSADGLECRSACGRFIIRRTCQNVAWSGYWSLNYQGKEYPCRTESSAKTAARNLANHNTLVRS